MFRAQLELVSGYDQHHHTRPVHHMSAEPPVSSAGRVAVLTGAQTSDLASAAEYRSLMDSAAPLIPVIMLDNGNPVYGRPFLEFVTATGEGSPALTVDLTHLEARLVCEFVAAAEQVGAPLCAVVVTEAGEVLAGNSLPDAPVGPMIVITMSDREETGL